MVGVFEVDKGDYAWPQAFFMTLNIMHDLKHASKPMG